MHPVVRLAIILALAVSPHERPIVSLERTSQCGAWEVSVYESGFVHTRATDTCGNPDSDEPALRRITPVEIGAIRSALASADFQSLPKSIEPDTYVTDEDVFLISVWGGSAVKRVSASGLAHAKDKRLAKRFETVMNAIYAIAPEPHRWGR